MHFATMSEWLSPAKISFACSAHYLDHINDANLTVEQQALLKDIPDTTFKESVRDFMVNQQFRRDFWIKGARKISAMEQVEKIKQQRLVLTSTREDVSMKIAGALGLANLNEAIYLPVIDFMSDHKIRGIDEIAAYVKAKEVSFGEVIQVVIVLIGSGHLASVQTDEQINKAIATTSKLNKALIDKARFSTETSFLASPVTGGGIAVNRFQQLFLLAINEGKKQPQEWAQFVWSLLALQNQRLLIDGIAIETTEGNLEELTRQAKEFAHNRMPILKALHVL